MTDRVLVFYTSKAHKDLRRLEKHISERIVEKVHMFAHSKDPLRYAKPLAGNFTGAYRYRVGDHRAVFNFDEKGTLTILTVLMVKHRKDIYR